MKINKKVITFGIPILAIALVSAVILFHYVTVDATVSEALSSATINLDVSGLPGETTIGSIDVSNGASVDLPVLLTWIEKSNKYSLDNSGGSCPGTDCEKRIVISQSDLGFTDLSDLETISWEADVISGYLPHVDVFLDNGETLVFEYAKVDPAQCDNAPYPTGTLNTFDDKGIVDGNAKAWLSSGVPGPCGDPTFEANYKTLTDWKTFYPIAKVERIEVEVDNWIASSNSDAWDVEVNGVVVADGVSYTTDMPKTVTIHPGANSIDVPFTYSTDTEPGKLSGRITLERI